MAFSPDEKTPASTKNPLFSLKRKDFFFCSLQNKPVSSPFRPLPPHRTASEKGGRSCMKDTDLKPWNCLLCRPEGPLICRAGKDASALPCMEQGGLPERLSGDESHAGGKKTPLWRKAFFCAAFFTTGAASLISGHGAGRAFCALRRQKAEKAPFLRAPAAMGVSRNNRRRIQDSRPCSVSRSSKNLPSSGRWSRQRHSRPMARRASM